MNYIHDENLQKWKMNENNFKIRKLSKQNK